MEKIKQKRKSTKEPQISANNRASRKRAKQDMVHKIVMTSIERKTRGDAYVNMDESIDDAIAVSPCIT